MPSPEPAFGSRAAERKLPGVWRWLVAALACGATALAAFALPVRLPEETLETSAAAAVGRLQDGIDAPAPETLDAVLPGRRWSDSPLEPEKPPAAAIEVAPLDVRYVGSVTAGRHRAALLDIPGAGIVRFFVGDTLPDGRVLASIRDDNLVLEAEGRPAEELSLFPHGPAERRVDGAAVPASR